MSPFQIAHSSDFSVIGDGITDIMGILSCLLNIIFCRS